MDIRKNKCGVEKARMKISGNRQLNVQRLANYLTRQAWMKGLKDEETGKTRCGTWQANNRFIYLINCLCNLTNTMMLRHITQKLFCSLSRNKNQP